MNARASESTQLRIMICGKLAVEARPVLLLERDFPARQGRRLWCYLVLERRRTIGRDELADALWGDDIPDGWDTVLHAVISRLRSTLKSIPATGRKLELISDNREYQLRLPDDVFIDFERARYGLHTAETASSRGDIAFALGEARVALEIAARGFLPGEGLPWVELRRRQLHEIRIHANECLAEGEMRRARPQHAEREAEQLLLIDPLNEHAYRIRMQAAAALDNRAGIARAMMQCRECLMSLAGMVPSGETERLFHDLTNRPDRANHAE